MFTALSRQKSIFGFFVSLGAKYPCDLRLMIQFWIFPKKRTLSFCLKRSPTCLAFMYSTQTLSRVQPFMNKMYFLRDFSGWERDDTISFKFQFLFFQIQWLAIGNIEFWRSQIRVNTDLREGYLHFSHVVPGHHVTSKGENRAQESKRLV